MTEQKTTKRKWTDKEDEYLLKKFSKQSVEITAQKLNRSASSVKHRAARLGLNHYIDNLGAKVIAQCFNSDLRVVKRWIDKYDLPAEKIKHSKTCRYNIDTIEFWKWAENHKELINWSKYERLSLLPEPDWVKAECSSYENINTRKRITKVEISRVKRMFGQGLTCEEISKEIGRSVYSVEHILRMETA